MILVPISWGELLDKITILEIKAERMADAARLANVRHELDCLRAARDAADAAFGPEIERLMADLKEVNEALWEIEDGIRDREAEKDFGARFIELARAVYHTNDRRAALKRTLNALLGSALVEEKSYKDYA
ncbi:MAG: hypothetical protein HQL41_04410 [Alphaproteobacteria bacterium]|nr:hypothetical protein [Alphaproteobacteria bacterium]